MHYTQEETFDDIVIVDKRGNKKCDLLWSVSSPDETLITYLYVFDSPTRTPIAVDNSNSEVIPHQDFNSTSFIDVMSMIPSSSPVKKRTLTLHKQIPII